MMVSQFYADAPVEFIELPTESARLDMGIMLSWIREAFRMPNQIRRHPKNNIRK